MSKWKMKIYYPLCQTYNPTVVWKSISKRRTIMQEASGWSTTPNATRTISCKAWNSPVEYPSWVARCDIKVSDGTMLNPLSWKKVQGQKHPGRWGIVEHQIYSLKVLFKTNTNYVMLCYVMLNTKSHKHPGIRLLSSESKTQLVNQRQEKEAFNPGTAHSPEIQSYRMWWGPASPILNDIPVVCIYTSYKRTHIENAYIYMNTEFLDGDKGHQEEIHHPNPQVSAPVPRPVVNEMERMCPRHESDQTPTLLFESKNYVSSNSYSITYAVGEFLLSIIPNSVIVWSLQ